LEQIAGLLAASPGIALTLRGSVSATDVRALQEQDLLAELRESWALGTRRTVRAHLEAKAKGEEAEPLDPDAQAWLDEQASAREIAPERLAALCDARARAVQQALVSEHGIATERLALGAAIVDAPAEQSGVALGLGADAATPQVGASKASESK
jgi:hypothetical protein